MAHSTSSMPLLKDGSPLPGFSEYDDTKSISSSLLDRAQRRRDVIQNRSGRKSSWQPFQLRTPVLILIAVLCLCIVVLLEVVLCFNQKTYGWKLPSVLKRFQNYHIFLTAVPGTFWHHSELCLDQCFGSCICRVHLLVATPANHRDR